MREQPRLLVIDDLVINLKVAIDYLQAYGYEVLVARSGELGLQRARHAQPDLILLDVQMPGLDGFETCRRLKAQPDTAPIPVLFMTVLDDPLDKIKGLELGAVDYLTKPFELAEALARIKTHLALYDLQRELETRVRLRTADLEAEVARRVRHEQERDRLIAIIGQQSDQLQVLTAQLLAVQQQLRQGISQQLQAHIGHEIGAVKAEITSLRRLVDPATLPQARAHLERVEQSLTAMGAIVQQLSSTLTAPSAQEAELRTSPLFKLATREREVLVLLAEGKTTTEIADLLVLTPATVYTYTRRIRQKLDIHDLAGLIRFALTHNLVR